jgi:hypothetical protein
MHTRLRRLLIILTRRVRQGKVCDASSRCRGRRVELAPVTHVAHIVRVATLTGKRGDLASARELVAV